MSFRGDQLQLKEEQILPEVRISLVCSRNRKKACGMEHSMCWKGRRLMIVKDKVKKVMLDLIGYSIEIDFIASVVESSGV